MDGPVRWLDVDPCYVFHPMNAFDDGDDVVIDVVRWDGMFRKGHQGPFESGQHSSLRRWTLDVAGGQGPRGRHRRAAAGVPAGRRARRRPPPPLRLRRDHRRRHEARPRPRARTRRSTSARSSGQNEAVFVPAHDGAAEDDGWLLCLTYDGGQDTSALTITHAQDLAAGPVATVHLDRRVPFGFHGNWVPDA